MEMTGQKYGDIMLMPVKFFMDHIKWKIAFDLEKQKKLDELTKEM